MTIKRSTVTYRLGTAGQGEVERALKAIGETGDAASKRIAAAFNRDARAAELALEKVERRAEQLKARAGTGVQATIDRTTGIAATGRSEAQARTDLVAALQREETAKARLLAQFDPLFAAQQRYNTAMAQATTLQRNGTLSTEEFARVQARATAELEAVRNAQVRATTSSGAMRAGTQQLGFQVSDFAVQMAGGTSAIRAFTLQGPQAVQALAVMGSGADRTKGKFAAFTSFLGGPWGAAITAGTAVVGLLVQELLSADKASETLEFSSYALSDAQGILGNAIDLTTGKVRNQSAALRDLAAAQILAGQVDARTKIADLESGLRKDAGETTIRSERIDGRQGNQRRFGSKYATVERQTNMAILAEQYLNRGMSGEQVVTVIEGMIARNEISPERGRDFATRIASLGVERENLRVFESAERLLDGEGTAADRGLLFTPPEQKPQRARRTRSPSGPKAPDPAKIAAENAEASRALIARYDPASAALFKRDDALAELARFTALPPAQGGIGSEMADMLRGKIQTEYTDTVFADQIKAAKEAAEARKAELDTIKSITAEQEDGQRILDAQAATIYATADQRERELAKVEFANRLRAQGLDLEDERVKALLEANDALLIQAQAMDKVNEQIADQRRIGEDLVDTLFDPAGWNDWGKTGLRVIEQLVHEMLTLAAINPLKNALFGTDYATVKPNGFLSFLGGIFSGAAGAVGGSQGGASGGSSGGSAGALGPNPGAASGLAYSPGGYYDVGEFGKERVYLPRGSQVYGASATRQMDRQGGAAPVIQFDLRNAVVTEDLLRQMQEMADRAAAQGASQGAEGGLKAVVEAHRRSHGRLFAPVG